MRKWAWRIFVAASAVLLVGTVGMWARAQWRHDHVMYRWTRETPEDTRQHAVILRGYRGSLGVVFSTNAAPRTAVYAIPAGAKWSAR